MRLITGFIDQVKVLFIEDIIEFIPVFEAVSNFMSSSDLFLKQ